MDCDPPPPPESSAFSSAQFSQGEPTWYQPPRIVNPTVGQQPMAPSPMQPQIGNTSEVPVILVDQWQPHYSQPGQSLPTEPQPGGNVGQAQPTELPAGHKHVLQQLLQVLRSPNSPEQQAQVLQILKSNPQLMAAYINQRKLYQSQGGGAGVAQAEQQAPNQHQQGPNVVNPAFGPQPMAPSQMQPQIGNTPRLPLISAEQWPPHHPQPPAVLQQNQGAERNNPQPPQRQPGQQLVAMLPPPAERKRVLQQLLQVLRSGKSSEQKAQVLEILKSHQWLMTAYLNQRKIYQREAPADVAQAQQQTPNLQEVVELLQGFSIND